MIYIRAALITTFVLSVAMLGYVYVSFGDDYRLELAHEHFLKREYTQADELLAEIARSSGDALVALPRAYLARATGDLDASDRWLSDARANRGVLAVNRGLNALLRGDLNALEKATAQAQEQLGAKHPYVRMLSASLKIDQGAYRQALHSLEALEYPDTGDAWLDKSVIRTLGKQWLPLQRARCHIGQGEQLVARQLLEEVASTSSGTEQMDAWFLLGLSYVEEAQQRPAEARLSYYKLALGYFERLPPTQRRFQRERTWVTEQLVGTLISLLDDAAKTELDSLVGTLVYWKQEEALKRVTAHLSQRFHEALDAQDWNKAAQLACSASALKSGEPVSERLEEQVLLLVEAELDRGETDKLDKYWKVLSASVNDAARLGNRLAVQAEADVLQRIEDDDAELTHVLPYIKFWELVERDSIERLAFAQRLVTLAGSLWVRDDAGHKSFAVMKVAETLPYLTEQQTFHQQVERTLRLIYHTAVEKDEVEKLGPLHQAIQHFHVDGLEIQDAIETANQLEDAAFLYSSGRYGEAERRLKLIRVVAPDDPRAQRLAGIVAVRLGHYEEGLRFLRQILKPDDEARSALGLAELLAGDPKLGSYILDQVAGHAFFDRELCTTVALRQLIAQEWSTAVRWFHLAGHQDPEISTGLAYAYAQLGQNDYALEQLRHLREPYSRLRGVQILAIEQLAEAGDLEAAGDGVSRLLKLKSQPGSSQFSKAFAAFKEQCLDPMDVELCAAEFYHLYQRDLPRALAHYERVENASEKVTRARVVVLLEMGEAASALREINTLSAPDPLLLARIYYSLADPAPCIDAYATALEEGAMLSVQERRAYIALLINEGDWARAEKQLEMLPDLQPHERLALLECQAHLGQLEELPAGLSLAARLRLAVALPDVEFGDELSKRLSPAEADEALSFALARNDLQLAAVVADRNANSLQETTRGLVNLAVLHAQRNNPQRSEMFLRKAYTRDPDDSRVFHAMLQASTSKDLLIENLQRHEKLLAKAPGKHQWRLRCALLQLQLSTAEPSQALRQEIEIVIAQSSASADSLLLKAELARREGRWDSAHKLYTELLKASPGHPTAQAGLNYSRNKVR